MGTHPIFESDFDCLTEGLFFTLNKCSSEMSDWESRRTCWVGNLSDKVTEEILFELFLQIGPLEDVTKPKNKNFAFILFTHKRSTTYAVKALNNVCLFGQMIHVKFREVKRNEGSRDRMDGRLGERRDFSRDRNQGRLNKYRDYDGPRERDRDRRDRDYDRRRPESYNNDDRRGRQVHTGADPWQARGSNRGNQWQNDVWAQGPADGFRRPPNRDSDSRHQNTMPNRSRSASNRRGDPGWR